MIENAQFVLRIPSFSFEILDKSFGNLNSFRDILLKPLFQEAIYIASPVLYQELLKYINGDLSNKEQVRVENAIIRYLERMCTRPTPFGLFASIAIGKVDTKTEFEIAEFIERKVRIDMFLLCRIVQLLTSNPSLKNKIKYYINSSLYEVNTSYRYIEYYYLNEQRKHRIVSVKEDSALRAVLKSAKKGTTFEDLNLLLLMIGYQDLESKEYIEKLIDSQILISELEPNLVGRDFFDRLVEKISKVESESELSKLLLSISNMLKSLEYNNDSDPIFTYNMIYQLIDEKLIKCNKSLFLQVDSLRQMKKATISYDMIEEIKKALVFLNKLSMKSLNNSDLELFKNRFVERYQDMEVSLLEALDPNIGLGYPIDKTQNDSELLNSFYFPINKTTEDNLNMQFEKCIINKLVNTYQEEIELDDIDISGYKEIWSDFPPTFSVKFEILDEKTIILDNASGISAGNLIARFSHCHNQIANQLKNIASIETSCYANKIVAEIVHLPESRVGNVLARSSFRDFELIYLAGFDDSDTRKIGLSDVIVYIKAGKIYLKSKKANQEIVPRLTTAHNYHYNSTPVYRFLCDLQHQSMHSTLMYSWATLWNKFDYFPRVKYGNVILSPALWKIKVSELKNIMDNNREDSIMKAITEFRKKKNMPAKVYLVDGDNTLFVNFEFFLSIRAFYDIINKRFEIILKEFVAPKETPIMQDSSGQIYINECIMFFENEEFINS